MGSSQSRSSEVLCPSRKSVPDTRIHSQQPSELLQYFRLSVNNLKKHKKRYFFIKIVCLKAFMLNKIVEIVSPAAVRARIEM